MVHKTIPTAPVSAPFVAATVGAHALFSGVLPISKPGALPTDLFNPGSLPGSISDVVVSKLSGSEVPVAGALVWILRRTDGLVVWSGYSATDGTYTATGLELGREYIPVAQDPLLAMKATAAGPVTAV